jgi:hypothetical protein
MAYTAVITIKHVSTYVNKVENPCNYLRIFDVIDKCRYVFYDYDGSIDQLKYNLDLVDPFIKFDNSIEFFCSFRSKFC